MIDKLTIFVSLKDCKEVRSFVFTAFHFPINVLNNDSMLLSYSSQNLLPLSHEYSYNQVVTSLHEALSQHYIQ